MTYVYVVGAMVPRTDTGESLGLQWESELTG